MPQQKKLCLQNRIASYKSYIMTKKIFSSLEAVAHALAARADWRVRDREDRLGLGRGVLSHLGKCVNDTTDETDKDGGNTAKRDRRIEEHQAAKRDGELVEGTDHRVRC